MKIRRNVTGRSWVRRASSDAGGSTVVARLLVCRALCPRDRRRHRCLRRRWICSCCAECLHYDGADRRGCDEDLRSRCRCRERGRAEHLVLPDHAERARTEVAGACAACTLVTIIGPGVSSRARARTRSPSSSATRAVTLRRWRCPGPGAARCWSRIRTTAARPLDSPRTCSCRRGGHDLDPGRGGRRPGSPGVQEMGGAGSGDSFPPRLSAEVSLACEARLGLSVTRSLLVSLESK